MTADGVGLYEKGKCESNAQTPFDAIEHLVYKYNLPVDVYYLDSDMEDVLEWQYKESDLEKALQERVEELGYGW